MPGRMTRSWLPVCVASAFLLSFGPQRPAAASPAPMPPLEPTLFLALPLSVSETTGLLTNTAQIFLSSTLTEPLEIHLSSDPSVDVPPTVIVPAGRQSLRFSLNIRNDDLVNPPNHTARITASAPGWITATNTLLVLDDESPDFTVTWPESLIEGVPALASLKLDVPRDHPVTVSFVSDHPKVPAPESFILAPGITTAVWTVVTLDDTLAEHGVHVRLCARIGHLDSPCLQTSIADDEVHLNGIYPVYIPMAIWSGQPFLPAANLNSIAAIPASITHQGTVSIYPPTTVRVVHPTNHVTFVGGSLTNEVTLEGASLNLQMVVTCNDFSQFSTTFAAIDGFSREIPILDIAAHPLSGNVLMSTGTLEDPAGQLVELNPQSGEILRQLTLPSPGSRLTLDAQGTRAWISSPHPSLQVVNLDTWQVLPEIQIDIPSTNAPTSPLQILALAALPGSNHRVAALIGPHPLPMSSPCHLVAFEDNRQLPLSIAINGGGDLHDVLAGRFPDEIFVRARDHVLRVMLTPDGPQSPTHQAWIGDDLNVALDGDRLVTGNGLVFTADTLEFLHQFVISWTHSPRRLVAPIPELDTTVFLGHGTAFMVFSDTTLHHLQSHALPDTIHESWSPYRLIRCGQHRNRFALLGDRGTRLLVWASPLIAVESADVEILVDGPSTVTAPLGHQVYNSYTIPQTITITNHGPHRAEGINVIQGIHHWFLGPLDPGTSTSFQSYIQLFHYGFNSTPFSVFTSSPDPHPENNAIDAKTTLRPFALPSTHILTYALQSVAPNASGDRLFLAVRHFEGHPNGAVLVLNPHLPAIESVIPIPHPQRLAVVPDGSALYVQSGTTNVVRWNLITQNGDLPFTLPSSSPPVLDLIPLRDGSGHCAVLSYRFLHIIHGPSVQASLSLSSTNQRRLLLADHQLWLFQSDRFRSFQFSDSSLTPSGPDIIHHGSIHPFPIFGDDHGFYFNQAVFHVASRTLLPTPPPAGIHLSDPAQGLFLGISGQSLQAHHLSTFELLGSETIPVDLPAFPATHPLVRWGPDGLAAIMSDQIVLFRSALLSSNTADLSVHFEFTPPLSRFTPFTAFLTVTNHGPQPASNGRLLFNLNAATLEFTALTQPPHLQTESGLLLEIGDLPPGQSIRFPFSGHTGYNPANFWAHISGPVQDPVPANNTARVDFHPPPFIVEPIVQDWSVPSTVIAGEEYDVNLSFTNDGPDAIPNAVLWLWDLPGTTILSNSWSSLQDQIRYPGPVPPHQEISLRLRLRSDLPGLYHLRAELFSWPAQLFPRPDPWAPIAVLPPPGSPVETFNHVHGLRFDWHPNRHQILSTWNHGLSLIDPLTLQPIRTLPTSRPPVRFILSQDLQSVWAADDSHRLQQVDLDGTRSYPPFAPFESPFFPRGGFTTVATQPHVVIVGGLRTNQSFTVTAYDNGVPRPHSLTLQGVGPIAMSTSPEDRIFLVAGPRLHELLLLPEGIFPLRELDWPDAWIYSRLSFAGPYLFGNSYANPIDPPHPFDAPVPIHLPYPHSLPIADARSQRVYMVSNPFDVQAIDAQSLRPLWSQFRNEHPYFHIGDLTSCGDLGILAQLSESTTTLLRHPHIVPLHLQLQANLTPTNHPGAPVPLQLEANLHNPGPQLARTAEIITTLSPGLRFLHPNLQESQSWTNNLQDFLGDFPFLTHLEPTASGPQWVRIQVIAHPSLSGPSTTNQLELTVTIPPPPYFLLGDTTLVEGPDYPALTATLSHPAPITLEVLYHVQSDNADPSDFGSPASFVFPAGSRHAEAHFLYPNHTPSPDKSFVLTFDQGLAVPIQTSAQVTLLDDDTLWIQPRTEQMLELNKPTNVFVFPLQLSHPFPLPIEVHYQLTPGTATPGEDYLPQNGTLLFEPGTTLLTLPITILGDTLFEPTETLFIDVTSDSFARFLPTRSTLNIRNDDPPPSPVLAFQAQPDGSFQLQFQAEDRIVYLIQVSTNLTTGNWRSIPPLVTGNGNLMTIPIPPSSQTPRFFRVRTN